MARLTIDKLQTAADEVVSLVDDLQSELTSWQEDCERLEKQLAEANSKIEDQQSVIDDLEKELAAADGKPIESTPATLYG